MKAIRSSHHHKRWSSNLPGYERKAVHQGIYRHLDSEGRLDDSNGELNVETRFMSSELIKFDQLRRDT
jgi:hypothetical protein